MVIDPGTRGAFMSAARPALLITTPLLGGCASPAHQQLGAALSGLEGS